MLSWLEELEAQAGLRKLMRYEILGVLNRTILDVAADFVDFVHFCWCTAVESVSKTQLRVCLKCRRRIILVTSGDCGL